MNNDNYKYIFFIVDCSGSIRHKGNQKIGMINSLLEEIIKTASRNKGVMTCIVTYADEARFHKEMSNSDRYEELSTDDFKGRSHLGRAYALIGKYIQKHSIKISECLMALISDGVATDDYNQELKKIDGNCEAKRLALSIGGDEYTLTYHVAMHDDLLFKDDKKFIKKIETYLG